MSHRTEMSHTDNEDAKYRRRKYEWLSGDVPMSSDNHHRTFSNSNKNNNDTSGPQQELKELNGVDNDVVMEEGDDRKYNKDSSTSVSSLMYESYQKDIWDPLFGTLPAPFGSRRPENKLIFAVAALILLTVTFLQMFISIPAVHFQNWSHQRKDRFDQQLALEESDGFFDDISSTKWMAMKTRFQNQPRHNDQQLGIRSDFIDRDKPQIWYQNNWDATFTCPHERRVGGTGDGGKWICDPHRIPKVAAARTDDNGGGCLIYSFGENSLLSLSFEKELQDLLGKDCEIHFFDESLQSQQAQKGDDDGKSSKQQQQQQQLPNGFLPNGKIEVHPWGLEAKEDAHLGRRNYLTLAETVSKLGHEGRVVDIFKLNCQACEWKTYKEWLSHKSGLKSIRQIIVELHGTPHIDDPFFDFMEEHNYVIFHKEADTQYSGIWQEYGFLRLAPSFFKK